MPIIFMCLNCKDLRKASRVEINSTKLGMDVKLTCLVCQKVHGVNENVLTLLSTPSKNLLNEVAKRLAL